MKEIILSELCSIQSGGTPSRKNDAFWGGNIPWAKISDLEASGDGYISDTEEHITADGLKAIRGRIFDEGTLLFAMYGSVGKTAIVRGNISTNQAILGIKPDAEQLDLGYLKYWLGSQQPIFDRDAQGVAQKNLSAGYVRYIQIPLPPLAEQKRIAAILDKADAIRRKRQQAIQLADEFLRATFLDMFGDPVTNPKGWEVKTLGEVALSFQNGIGKNKEHYGTGEKVVNIGDLYDSSSFEPKKYSLLDVSPKEIEKYRLSKGDILFVRSSVKKEGVAYCSAYDSEELCLFSSFMIRMKIDTDNLLPNFLSVQLRTPSQRTCLINASNTATITNINQAGLSNVNIIIPILEAQQLFTEKQRAIFATVEKIKSQLVRDDALFNSLSQRAFAGLL